MMRKAVFRTLCIPRKHQGFTLIELLVVLALLALLVVAMGSALRTTAQTEERVDQRLVRTDEMRVASSFVRSVLGRISARKKAGLPVAGENPYLFSGLEREITWVGIMPARYGAGGRHYFRLALEDTPAGQSLVLRFAPWMDDAVLPNWSEAESYALVTGVTDMGVQYGDARVEPPVWTAQWTSPDRLPQHVMLSLGTLTGPWPEMVIALRNLPASERGSGGAVFGGGE